MTLAQAAPTEVSARETRDEWIDRHSGRIMVLPAVIILLGFSIFPLIVSIYLSLCRFALAGGSFTLTFIGLHNYKRLLFGSQQFHLVGMLKPIEPPGWIAFAVYAVAVLSWLVRYVRTEFTVLGFVGRLISIALATGLLLALLATLPPTRAIRARCSRLASMWSSASAQFLIGLGLAFLCTLPLSGRASSALFLPAADGDAGRHRLHVPHDGRHAEGPLAPLWAGSDSAHGLGGRTPGRALMVVIGDTWQWVPFMFLVLLAALEGTSRDQIEAAQLDGASGWHIFRDVTWPSIAPVAATAVLIRLIEAFKVVDLPNVLTNGGPGIATESMTLHAFIEWRTLNLGGASAVAICCLRLHDCLRVVLPLVVRGAQQEGNCHESR